MNKVNLKYVFYFLVISLSAYLLVNTLILNSSNKIEDFSVIRPINVQNTTTRNDISNTSKNNIQFIEGDLRNKLWLEIRRSN